MKYDFHGYLLASDIDGTLINSKFEIPQINIEKINMFRECGGKFTLATGRSVESTRRFANMIELDTPAIVLNGAGIYDYKNDKFLYNDTLDKQEALSIIEFVLAEFPEIGIEIHSNNLLNVIRDNFEVEEHIKNELQPAAFPGLSEMMDKPWHKLLFAASSEKLKRLEDIAESFNLTKSYFVKTGPVYFELLNGTADKGNGLAELAKQQGIEISKVAAIGDFYNDVQLINAASISAYAQNAPEDLKRTADFVSVHCEEGAVAAFIDYLGKLSQR